MKMDKNMTQLPLQTIEISPFLFGGALEPLRDLFVFNTKIKLCIFMRFHLFAGEDHWIENLLEESSVFLSVLLK